MLFVSILKINPMTQFNDSEACEREMPSFFRTKRLTSLKRQLNNFGWVHINFSFVFSMKIMTFLLEMSRFIRIRNLSVGCSTWFHKYFKEVLFYLDFS